MLAEDDMPDYAEPCVAPCWEEAIHTIPGVEAHAESTPLQDSVHFGECWTEPAVVVVVRNGSTVAVAVVHEVRRIRENEID